MKVAQVCLTLCNPMNYTVHGILQARILEWVAVLFSRGASQPRDWTQVSCLAGGFFTSWATTEAHFQSTPVQLLLTSGGASGKELTCQCRRWKRCGFDPWVRKISWRRVWKPTPVFLPRESQRAGHNWSDVAPTHRRLLAEWWWVVGRFVDWHCRDECRKRERPFLILSDIIGVT